MARDYDAVIAEHYRQVAESDGLSPSSTMADEIVRATETEAIRSFLKAATNALAPKGEQLRIADVGCGNGYSLATFAAEFTDHAFVGIEQSTDLRALAETRLQDEAVHNAAVRAGDIREADLAHGQPFDALYCQRVLINLLDPADQKAALRNIIEAVTPGGVLLFIEAFNTSLARLNEARAEFELPAVPPAHHNIYLDDDFFDHAGLVPFEHPGWTVPPNFLSTHYYVSRVLYPALLGPIQFKRNAHFIKVLSAALPPALGDYAQIRAYAFRRV